MSAPTARTETDLAQENERLRAQLAEAQEVIRAIQSGEVDAVVMSGPEGDQVFTLEGAEHAYRILVEAMNEGAATLSEKGVILYCNQRLADLVDTPLHQVVGASARELVAAGSRDSFDALVAGALAGRPGKCELELETLGGDRVPAYVSLRAMTDGICAICMVATDLTEQKKSEDLIVAGELARSILDSAAEAIAVCDSRGFIVAANREMKRLCHSAALFQHFDKVLPLQSCTEGGGNQPFSVSALYGKELRSQEVVLVRDHASTWLLLNTGSLATASGYGGCVVTLTDITERKFAQQALLRSERLALVGRMTARMAHEINNPLSAVGNLLYLIKMDEHLTEEVRNELNTADEELQRIEYIVHQSLGFYRESNGPTPTCVRDVLDSTLQLLRSRIREKNAVIDYQWKGEAVKIDAFPGELRQVYANLVVNSLDALDQNGKVTLRVSNGTFNDGRRCLRVTVADNGKGISANSLPHIFEPFYTTKGAFGTGIGLWVSKQIVEKHKGTIRVRSSNREGRNGTVFSVALPIEAAAQLSTP